MKIDHSKPTGVVVRQPTFGELGYGDAFKTIWSGPTMYLKVLDGSPKAITLETGLTVYPALDTPVIPQLSAVVFVNGKE